MAVVVYYAMTDTNRSKACDNYYTSTANVQRCLYSYTDRLEHKIDALSREETVQNRQNMSILLIGVALIFAIAAVAIFAIGASVPTDDPVVPTTDAAVQSESDDVVGQDTVETEEYLVFPEIRGTDLDFEQIRVPGDLTAGPKLIVVSYDDNQQGIVNAWFEPLVEINDEFPALSGYYVPLLPKDASDGAAFIIGGFAALANDDERDRTIIVFTNVEQFNELTAVEGTDVVQLFLLNSDHQIVWRAEGEVDDAKLDGLQVALTALDEPTPAAGQ